MKIESLYRYPVKGLTPEPLAEAALTPGRCLPWDRSFALAQGDSSFDAAKSRLGSEIQFHVPAAQRQNRAAGDKVRRRDPPAEPHHAGGRDAAGLARLRKRARRSLTEFFIDYLGEEARYGEGKGRLRSTISRITVFATTKPRLSA